MNFRVTPQVNFTRIQFDLARSFNSLSKVQAQLSSGKRVTVMSDDPARSSRALEIRATLLRTERTRENVALARQATDSQAATLEEVSDLVAQAREKIEASASGAKTPAELDIIAGEIETILEQLVSVANRNEQNRYLFAGSQVNTQPFKVTKDENGITSVSYTGDDIVRKVRLGPGETKDMEMSGLDAFFKMHRGPTNLTDSTGVASVPGAADTITGSAKLTFTHTSTTIGDGAGSGGSDSLSGLAAGTSSGDDTILGDHSLVFTTDENGQSTVSLDGGPAAAFKGDETDFAVTNSKGDVVHLDTTALAAGFAGEVTIHGAGQVQVGNGAAVNLTFTEDLALKDEQGRTVHLNTTGVRRAGEDLAVFPGTVSIFENLIQVRDDLRGKSGFDEAGIVGRSVTRLAGIDRAHHDIVTALAKLGGRSASFQRIEGSLELFELNLTEKQSALEDTDFFKASVELSQAETTYQAALSIAARIATAPSLADYL